MNKIHIYLSIVVCGFLWSCSDSTSPDDPYSLLAERHLFIGAILVPNDERNWRQEVFVGYLDPNEEAPPVVLGQDSLLQRVLWSMRARYRAQVTGLSNAQVEIVDEDGSVVPMTHDINGYYVDAQGLLSVRHLVPYSVKVKVDGKEYGGSTIIPGSFGLTDPGNGDTMTIYPVADTLSQLFGTPIAYFSWSESEGALFYHMRARKTDWSQIVNTTGFENTDGLVFPGEPGVRSYETNWVEVRAIDENYAKIFHAGEPFAANEDWFAWWDLQTPLYITERSTITGGNGVTGVFGSISRVVFTFVADVQR